MDILYGLQRKRWCYKGVNVDSFYSVIKSSEIRVVLNSASLCSVFQMFALAKPLMIWPQGIFLNHMFLIPIELALTKLF